MPTLSFPALKKDTSWTISNQEVSIGIEKKTGFIRSLVFKKNKLDLFKELRGGIPAFIDFPQAGTPAALMKHEVNLC